jgi:hypothetical protein
LFSDGIENFDLKIPSKYIPQSITHHHLSDIPKRIPYCRLSMVKSALTDAEIMNRPTHQIIQKPLSKNKFGLKKAFPKL